MKLKIEAKPGELSAKLPDLIKTLEKIAGHPDNCDCLSKAKKPVKEKDLTPIIPVLAYLYKDGLKRRDKIVKTMTDKILEVLK